MGNSFLDKIKQPSFWVSMIGILGAVAAGLTGSGEPHLIAIGAILTGVYTIVDHLKDAVTQAASAVSTAKVEAAQAQGLPPFYQSDAQHPAVQAPAGPAQGVAPTVVADQQAQINEVSKQIADLHDALNKAVARSNSPSA